MAESQQSGDCTEQLMLGDWSTSLSTRTRRTVPTTEHLTLGDWSPSLSTRNFKDYTDHRALDARELVAQSISSELQYIALTTERSMLGDRSYSIATQNSKKRTRFLGTGRHTIIHPGTGRLVYSIAEGLSNSIF